MLPDPLAGYLRTVDLLLTLTYNWVRCMRAVIRWLQADLQCPSVTCEMCVAVDVCAVIAHDHAPNISNESYLLLCTRIHGTVLSVVLLKVSKKSGFGRGWPRGPLLWRRLARVWAGRTENAYSVRNRKARCATRPAKDRPMVHRCGQLRAVLPPLHAPAAVLYDW